jgi:hypothetical protein
VRGRVGEKERERERDEGIRVGCFWRRLLTFQRAFFWMRRERSVYYVRGGWPTRCVIDLTSTTSIRNEGSAHIIYTFEVSSRYY